jgi:exo-beta-1,3-glucanase (GH17 family)
MVLSNYLKIFFLSVILAMMGCSKTDSSLKANQAVTDDHSNYRLDNGQLLLGNKNYPAISYSGDRTVARTIDNSPSLKDIKEDLKILSAMGVKLLRTYNTIEFPQSERILMAIRQLKQADPNFEMYVMLGAWIQCKNAFKAGTDHSVEDLEWNMAEIEGGIKLAAQYPDVVKIIAVGNETMVTWQSHFVPASVILKWVNYLKEARTTGRMPAKTLVTTSDNWAALGGEEKYHNEDLLALLKAIDFVSLHTYAFHDAYYDQAFKWGLPQEAGLSITEQSVRAVKRAIAHQIEQYEAFKSYMEKNGIHKQIHIGETGWASLDNSHYGDTGTCETDEYKTKLFYDAVRKWTTDSNMTCFYFEAFDEPWKSGGTEASEGHFGLFTVDGKAKYPLWGMVDKGVFNGLTRGGNPVVKTLDGNEAAMVRGIKAPAPKKNQ